MTTVFNAYAAYYDLLYQEKDYKAEAEYVHRLIQKNKPGAKTILELGCGTGQHAVEFTRLGYDVVGMDLSQEMVNIANSKNIANTEFVQGDVRSLELNRKFDAVISLFHVMSYQTTNKDLEGIFGTAKNHLVESGVFLFDCWYGPAFLTDLPETRVKEIENESIKVHRTSTSEIDYHQNRIDVNFEVKITDKATGVEEYINETHNMRYLFLPEIYSLASSMEVAGVYDWMTEELTLSRYIIVICINDGISK